MTERRAVTRAARIAVSCPSRWTVVDPMKVIVLYVGVRSSSNIISGGSFAPTQPSSLGTNSKSVRSRSGRPCVTPVTACSQDIMPNSVSVVMAALPARRQE